jgi:hypothetical protein
VQGNREDFGKVLEENELFSARRSCHSSTRKYGRFWKSTRRNKCFSVRRLGAGAIQEQEIWKILEKYKKKLIFPLSGTEMNREDFGKLKEENECFFQLGGAAIQVHGNTEDFGKVQEEN